MILRIFYRIEVTGMSDFPEQGGVLIVSNHLSYADPVFIGAAFPRKVRYLTHKDLAQSKFMRAVFRLTDTLTISSANSLASLKQSIKRISTGMPLCLFAEERFQELVTLPFMRGSILLAKSAKVPNCSDFLDGVWVAFTAIREVVFLKKYLRLFPTVFRLHRASNRP